MQTTANILADTYETAFGLTRYYTSNLKEADPYKQWEVNGVKLNSILWLNAHLCWAENFLLLKATGGTPSEFEWLENYGFGSDGNTSEQLDMKTILTSRKTIHEAAMNHIRTLSDEELEKDNLFQISFGYGQSIKNIIQHAIRHEGTHAGHLGWLCKINGVKTV